MFFFILKVHFPLISYVFSYSQKLPLTYVPLIIYSECLPNYLAKHELQTCDQSRTHVLCGRTSVCLRLKICEMYSKNTDGTCPVDVSGDRFDLGDC